jgi:hypothetical protein
MYVDLSIYLSDVGRSDIVSNSRVTHPGSRFHVIVIVMDSSTGDRSNEFERFDSCIPHTVYRRMRASPKPTVKFCKDCKHFRPPKLMMESLWTDQDTLALRHGTCDKFSVQDPVSAAHFRVHASHLRKSPGGLCGYEGRLFEGIVRSDPVQTETSLDIKR